MKIFKINMTMNNINKITFATICAVVLLLASCKKDDFSVPDPGANIDPADIHATATIHDLKKIYYNSAYWSGTNPKPILMDSDLVISAIINGDDKSGNLYKVLSMQDSTGGIQIKIDGTNLYYNYPIGRRIFIKTKGLYFFSYGGTIELGGYIDTVSGAFPTVGALALTKVPNYVVKGKWGLNITPLVVTIPQLIARDPLHSQSLLYQIDNVEFIRSDTSTTYVPYNTALVKGSFNKTLTDCSGNRMVVRTSGYSSYALAKPNRLKGTIYGLYTYYQYTSSPGNYQMNIRDTTDVTFSNPSRCE